MRQSMMWRRMRSDKGFSLVEVLVVLGIIGVLTAIGMMSYNGARQRAQDTACDVGAHAMRTGAEAYYAQTGPESVYGNEFAIRSAGFLAQLSTTHDMTVGVDVTAATAATNSETSLQTGDAYVIKVQSAKCGTVGDVVP